MRSWLTYIAVMLVVSSCYNTSTPPIIEPELPKANTTIASLRAMVIEGERRVIEQELVVVGRVTSSDADNNFYRSMTVEDNSGGMEILMGIDKLHTTYPEGLRIALRLKGCALGYGYGTLQLGHMAESYDNYDIDYLGSKVDIDNVVVRSNDVEPIIPQRHTIAELHKGMCGRLVTIDNLRLVASTSIDTLNSETLANAKWQGYALFCDEESDTIVVYTRSYASFANKSIPLDKTSLSGIVQYGKYAGGRSYYQLKMRHEEDCIINNTDI